MKTVKNTNKAIDRDLVEAILIIATNKDELSADMPLGEFLDWMDAKFKNNSLPDTIVKLSRKENVDILDIAEVLTCFNPDNLPHSIEEILEMEPDEVKYEMEHNEDFYFNTLELCEDQINRMIKYEKKIAEKMYKEGKIQKRQYNKIQKAKTMYDLIWSGHYSDESEAIDILVDKYIFAK